MSNKLRLLDRALRPGAAARRDQALASAQGNDRLAELTAALRGQQDLLARAVTLLEQIHETLVHGPPVTDERNRQYDEWTLEVIRRVLGRQDTGIDVGAHQGSILRQIVAAAPDGRHFAFEPIPALAAQLRVDFPTVDVHELALSDAAGTSSFHHVVSNPGYSGLRRRRFDRDHEDVEVTTVNVGRLDDILPPELPVRFVKIDVEGGELGVLQGAERTILTHRPIVVFEFGLGASDFYGTTPKDVFTFFEATGMAVTLLDRWLAGHEPLTPDEFAEQYEKGINYYFLAYPRHDA